MASVVPRAVETTFDFGVVGGGIVGLAVAARLSQFGSVGLFEQHERVIRETSSRNSGVVHAGLYYHPDYLKTSLCIKGNQAMWNLQKKFPERVLAKRIGKWIGAADDAEVAQLQRITHHMETLGIPYRRLSQSEMKHEEPHVSFVEAIHSVNTGIVDVSSLADFLMDCISQHNSDSITALQAKAIRTQCLDSEGKHLVTVRCKGELDTEDVLCNRLVFSMGLHTEAFWRGGGIVTRDSEPLAFNDQCKMHFCRGRYVGYRDAQFLHRLVYPCPLTNLKGLGVHSVVDMQGCLRLGPDAHYVDRFDDVKVGDDDAFLDEMFQAARKFLPKIQRDKMFVDFAGMRPKLSGEGEAARDFFIEKLSTGAVMLSGIESPGLTSSLSIADYVAEIILGDTAAKSVPSIWS